MEFGVPKRREFTASKEKYENISVITVSEFKGKGTGRTLTFNKKAVESLGLDFEKEAQVSFSFDKMSGTVIVANTTGLKNVSEVKVAKTSKSISDKAYFEAIKENFKVDIAASVELKMIQDGEFNGFPTFKLEKLESTDVMNGIVQEAAQETEVEDIAVVDPTNVATQVPEEAISAPESISLEDQINESLEAPIEHVIEQAQEREEFETMAATEEQDSKEEENKMFFEDPQAEAVESPVAETEVENPFLTMGDL